MGRTLMMMVAEEEVDVDNKHDEDEENGRNEELSHLFQLLMLLGVSCSDAFHIHSYMVFDFCHLFCLSSDDFETISNYHTKVSFSFKFQGFCLP